MSKFTSGIAVPSTANLVVLAFWGRMKVWLLPPYVGGALRVSREVFGRAFSRRWRLLTWAGLRDKASEVPARARRAKLRILVVIVLSLAFVEMSGNQESAMQGMAFRREFNIAAQSSSASLLQPCHVVVAKVLDQGRWPPAIHARYAAFFHVTSRNTKARSTTTSNHRLC
jgi:hypothetical protein